VPTIPFPKHRVVSLQDLATRVLDKRGGSDKDPLARDLLEGFYEVCMQLGLDRVLVELEQAHPPLQLVDGRAIYDHFKTDLVERLDNKAEFDPGGPRNAKPRQLADAVIAALGLTLVDEPAAKVVMFEDTVHSEVSAAMAAVVESELRPPKIRETIIAQARAACEERFLGSFDRIAAQLDERGMRMIRQPKVPLDAVQAVQKVLFETREKVFGAVVNIAVDRAKHVLARVDADVAARIEVPISLRSTPRDVVVRRANDPRVTGAPPAALVQSLVDSLAELLQIAWRPAVQTVRPYSASQTFVVGELLEHPKFGRGSVVTVDVTRIEVEFPEGKYTLVHGRGAK
jgi:hypothetical protein